MLRKKCNPTLKAETILKLTIHSQYLQNYFYNAKIKILTYYFNFEQGVRT